MKTVNFTEMKNGTEDDYLFLDKHEQKFIDGTARKNLLSFAFTSSLTTNIISTIRGYIRTHIGMSESPEKKNKQYLLYYSGELGVNLFILDPLYIGISYEMKTFHSIAIVFNTTGIIAGVKTSL